MLSYTCEKRNLKPNFPNTPWAACTFNVGGDVVTQPHLDCANLAFGWCAVTAVGSFNPDLGGHMILWDLGVYVRFPPGSTILLPSALVVHSNVPIQKDETRSSMTQYSAGSLFRWVYNGGLNDKEFAASATEAERKKKDLDNQTRWANGLVYFPTM